MSYKVFLVEDEIVTREGIRNNVDWEAAGFEFCGEAPDGEIALPLIEETRPDVLITDIKMPFMDGLQLSKIIREHMPWVKIIILSGHNEFEYAQSAVKLGVTEYLLKPVSAKDLHQVMEGLFITLERDKQEREELKRLQEKFVDNLVISRERFLLKLVMGGVSSADAIEQSQQLGLDIVARNYLVVLIRIELCEHSQPFDYDEYQRVEQIVSDIAGNNPDVFLTKKDLEELVLLIKGDSLEQLVQEGSFLAGLIKDEVEKQSSCNIVIEIGRPQDRLGNIHHSFSEALVKSKSAESVQVKSRADQDHADLIMMDHEAIENYIKFGSINDFDEFFTSTLRPIGEMALHSYLMKHYLFVDIILTTKQFMSNFGGGDEKLVSAVQDIENILSEIKDIEHIKGEMRKIFTAVLAFRNNQANHERLLILQQAKAFLDENFTDPDLKMSRVAQEFNISPSHFSTIFRQELGITYRDYISQLKINYAKQLLRTTNLKCSEIAYRCGFTDSHYFSVVFKKKTGFTPRQFRAQSQEDTIVEQ
ncbi:MAG: response regulator [Anaerolineales bacterium]|jgi:two-component system response regulator YesN